MGAIVRLLEKHRKSESVTVGCFGNLYKSVVDMSIDYFETESCKQMLMYPRNSRDAKCRRLKLNINPTDDDLKYFGCSTCWICKTVSNFNTSRCRCGNLMNKVKEVTISASGVVDNIQDGVFFSGRCSFIITDDLKVAVTSTDLVLNKLKSIGYGTFSKVGERLVDIGFEEVLTLLQCIFSSNAPLTDAFLNKQAPQCLKRTCETPSLYMERKRDESETEVINLSMVVRKHDMKVLYVECGEDFVDLLFTFLAVPLDSVLEISGNSSTFGYIRNLVQSFKDLSSATEDSVAKSALPHYYRCQKQLLNIITDQPQALKIASTNVPVVCIDPKSHGIKHSAEGSWFVKRNTKFTVSDDLIITPMNSRSIFCSLLKLEIQAEDLKVQEIRISKTEATSLLRASLVTSSALNTALRKES